MIQEAIRTEHAYDMGTNRQLNCSRVANPTGRILDKQISGYAVNQGLGVSLL